MPSTRVDFPSATVQNNLLSPSQCGVRLKSRAVLTGGFKGKAIWVPFFCGFKDTVGDLRVQLRPVSLKMGVAPAVVAVQMGVEQLLRVLLAKQMLEQCAQLLGMTVVSCIDHDGIRAEQDDGVGAQPATLEHNHIAREGIGAHRLGFKKEAVIKSHLRGEK